MAGVPYIMLPYIMVPYIMLYLPILTWVITKLTNKTAKNQQSSITKWKWYIQNWAQPESQGTSRLHKQLASLPERPNDP